LSWAAHDFEPYVIQKHLGDKVTIIPLYIGSIGPDLFTKWYVYGVNLFGTRLGTDDPVNFHRGWPGVGFTHSPFFALLVGLACLAITHNKVWSLSLGLGWLAHALTDTLDTNGTMLMFPFSLDRVSIGAWRYASEEGRFGDAIAYYGSLGLVADLVWGVLALLSFRVMQREYFEKVVYNNDPLWAKFSRLFNTQGLLIIYRLGFIYGAGRMVAWLVWVHVVHDNPIDLSWGGPYWVTPIR
jgi:membrane-bound metal-dependent hydrolase YbcI (DUF457 family)